MDFVDGLPKSAGFDCILVVVDKFSKFAHFIPLKHPYTTLSVRTTYMKEVFKLHSMPEVIISDRDPVFTSKVRQELFRLSDTKLCMSLAHHPETDGKMERVNQCMEGYLRCFVHSCPTKWAQWIYLTEFWYNTTFHSSLGKSPFEVLYGHAPMFFGIEGVSSCVVANLDEWL
jgi:hypothetical protein